MVGGGLHRSQMLKSNGALLGDYDERVLGGGDFVASLHEEPRLGGKLGSMNWNDAKARARSLKSGDCGLKDGSTAGQWRLPTKEELVDIYGSKSQFNNVQSTYYWSSSPDANNTTLAWLVYMDVGYANVSNRTDVYYVWPVRGGQ